MPLSLLDEKVRSRLRSGVAIPSMAQCVGELVENAIDASAKCIAVRVDVSKYKIQVIDNGKGVLRKDMDLIGQRYATSKCHTLADLDHSLQHLGYRGEALASTIDCSGTVEILSRHHQSHQSYSKLFHHGKPMPVTLSSEQRPSVGSTITVHDFFYNLPVRRKAISAVLETESIRHALLCIALANPSVSFSLRNDLIGECILQTRRTNSVLASFSILFGSRKAGSMKEVSLSHSTIDITGYVSTESHHSKALQFVYVNGRLVKKTALHSCVNNLIANSLVARGMSKQANTKWRSQTADVTSPRRPSERHGVYVLMIKCLRSEYDICLEPAKTLIEFKDWEVLDCLTQVVRQFLIKHSLTLRPECVEEQQDEDSGEEGHGPREERCGSREEGCGPREEEHGSREEERGPTEDGCGFEPAALGSGDMGLKTVSGLCGNEEDTTSTIRVDEERVPCTLSHSDARHITPQTHCRSVANPHRESSNRQFGGSSSCSRKRAPVLKLDGPFRSPLNSRTSGVRSKLAGFLRSELQRKQLHSAVSASTTHVSTAHVSTDYQMLQLQVPHISVSARGLHEHTMPMNVDHRTCDQRTVSHHSFSPSITSSITSGTSTGGQRLLINVPHLASSAHVDASSAHVDALSAHVDASSAHVDASSAHVDASSAHVDASSAHVDTSSAHFDASSAYVDAEHGTTLVGGVCRWQALQSDCSLKGLNLHSTDNENSGAESAKYQLIPEDAHSLCNTSQETCDITCDASQATCDASWETCDITCDASPMTCGASQTTYDALWETCDMTCGASQETCDTSQMTCDASRETYDMSQNACLTSSFQLQRESSVSSAEESEPPSETGDNQRNITTRETIWKEFTDPITAKKVYVHSKTGNSYSSIPCTNSVPSFGLVEINSDWREHKAVNTSSEGNSVSNCYGARPIRAAPHLSCDLPCLIPGAKRLRVSNDDNDSIAPGLVGGALDEGGKTSESGAFESLLRNWKNPTFVAGQEGILGSGYGPSHGSQMRVHKIINHYKFSKEMLKDVKVLGQVDKKFIACILDTKGSGQHDLLVFFDQHAAHERVRLEALHADLYESSDTQNVVKSSKVHPPLLISLAPAEKKLARTFHKQLAALGVTLVHGGSSVGVASLPSVLMEREFSEVKRGRPAVALDMVRDMIVKHLEVLRATSGASSAIPASLHNILNSQACHSAIKFGDSLTDDDCAALIQSLANCKLPFQCAHGRPSVVPILDLDTLQKKYQLPAQTKPRELCKKLAAKIKGQNL